ncbi:MAG: lytic transglycosylase domain-containing protein [Proteobacteria bacterium]|nr:lytic transglycosylase domain-containing protein [Pseudomonadota bacterium]
MAGRKTTATRIALAAFVAALLGAPVQAAEIPFELATSTTDPLKPGGDPAIDPWGAAANRPVVPNAEKPAAPEIQTGAPTTIQPVQDHLVGKLVQWALLRDTDRKQSFEELTAFISANPDWPKLSTLIRKAERAIDGATPTRAKLDWFENHAPRTLEGSIAWSQALIVGGNERKATDIIRRGWARFDMSSAAEKRYLATFGAYLEPEDNAARLDRLLWDNRRTAARRLMGNLGQGRRALADARLRLMGQKGGVDAAIEKIPSWLENDPGLYYERVRWRRRKEMNADAADLLLSYRGELSHPARWWSEREILARRFLRNDDPGTAYRLVHGHGLTDRAKRADAEFLAGWISLRFMNDPHTAFGHFSTLYGFVSYPISRARGAYWAGRAAEGAGEKEISRQWYRTAAGLSTTFYGQLAANRLGMASPPPASSETRIDAAEAETFERDDLVRLARLLIGLKATSAPTTTGDASTDPAKSPMTFLASLDDDEALIPLLRHIAWRSKTATEWVKSAKLARDAGRTEIAVYIARRAARDGVLLRDLGYPTLAVEGKLPLNPALLHALVRQESAFDPAAHSRAGARGLMQLMPATAKKVARDLEIKGHSTNRLTADPYHNLTLGSAYLDDLLIEYEGSMVMALAGYNAGPHRVKKWQKENGDPRGSLDDAIDWIESIPFSETRNYVQRILETLPIYRWKLDDERIVLLHPEDLTRGLPGYDRPKDAE